MLFFQSCLPTDPSSPPSEVQITYVGKREATLTWQPPMFEDQNGVIVYYELVVSQSQFEISDIIVNANTTSHTVTNLEEHVQYTVVVAAATRIGVGPFSSAVNFTTQQDGKTHAFSLQLLSIIFKVCFPCSHHSPFSTTSVCYWCR